MDVEVSDSLRPHFYVNWTQLCGNQSLSPWIPEDSDFGRCFESLFLQTPAHGLFALLSAYALGVSSNVPVTRTSRQRAAVTLRQWTCFGQAAAAVITYCLLNFILPEENVDLSFGLSQLVEVSVVMASWMCNGLYSRVLRRRGHPSHRGSKAALIGWFLSVTVDVVSSRTIIHKNELSNEMDDILFGFAVTRLCLHALYVCSLFPSNVGPDDLQVEVSSEWTVRTDGGYARLGEENELSLGVAKEYDPWISRLVLFWVNPLITKARRDLIDGPSDVYELPTWLKTETNSHKFESAKERRRSLDSKVPLIRVLWSVFRKQFVAVGLLKLLADLSGFAGPLLLNRLVSFVENRNTDIKWGYFYTALLTASTLSSALCNVHFNLLVYELNLQVRAALVAAIYRHSHAMSSISLGAFTQGEIINFMGTDTDRIVAFSNSFHAAWSLPFQFVVTLILLYLQLGLSSLTGVVLTLLMVPLNKVIADAIGRQSTHFMEAKDSRVQEMTEVVSGMFAIRFNGWEHFFAGRVNGHRERELKYLKWRKYLDAICVYLWATTPVLISVMTFIVYVCLGNELTAAKVFTAVALFAMLTGPVNALPWVINGLVESLVSVRRIQRFLSVPKFAKEDYFAQMEAVADIDQLRTTVIAMSKASLSTSQEGEDDFSLEDLELTVKKGEFIGVIGKVGAGKSLFLQSILGELRRRKGLVAIQEPPEGVGYVQQEPWLQRGTVRDNILFGKSLDQQRYEQVLDACALTQDLQQLSAGDLTDVGEGGAMLSGGQKARVALARAVYQDKEVYLIDDVFAAVDGAVGSHIYHRCVMGLLREKTRVLCTHHPRFLAGADRAFLMAEGRIMAVGEPQDVVTRCEFNLANSREGAEEQAQNCDRRDIKEEQAYEVREEELVSLEGREHGKVRLEIVKHYWRAVGRWLSLFILCSLVLMQATRNLTDVWLARWVSSTNGSRNGNFSRTEDHSDMNFYLVVYGSLGAANSLFSFIRAFLFAYGGICAARSIHEKLLEVILAARLVFFDSTPEGRILNRFAADVNTVDDNLPFILNIFLAQLFGVFGPLIVCVYSLPWLILVLLPLSFFYFDIQGRYRPASRDLKRLQSVSLSPLFGHFSESLRGLATIRAMAGTDRFTKENDRLLEANQRVLYAGYAAGQWLELRLQLIGCALVAGVSILAIVEHHTSAISAGYVGLAISYALGITGKLSGLLSSFTETERELVAVERCHDYIDKVFTEKIDQDDNNDRTEWRPSEGVVCFKDVTLRYRPHLPAALTTINFETLPSEKLGIIGRTGAGKSSIFRALFRTVDICEGEITIDGKNINSVGLKTLRKSLTAVTQDTFLFSGSVRQNLDPLSHVEDNALWVCLQKAGLEALIHRLGGLEGKIEAKGKSLSVGEKQLLCAARAVLSTAKVRTLNLFYRKMLLLYHLTSPRSFVSTRPPPTWTRTQTSCYIGFLGLPLPTGQC